MENSLTVPPRSEEGTIEEQFAGKLRTQINLRRAGFAGLAVVGLIGLLPLLQLAVQAGVLLFALGGLVVAAGVAARYVPLLLLKAENQVALRIMAEKNKQLARLKDEARKNPIEQAQNDYLRRVRQYDTFKAAMEQIGGQVASLESQLADMKRRHPGVDYSQQEQAFEKMKLFYSNRKDRLKVAYIQLGKFKEKIDEANSKWQFQLAANQAIKAMNATDQDAKIQEILTSVSFDTVQQEFDSVFAKIDIDAAEMSAQNQLEFGPGATLDVSHVLLPDPVPVGKGGES